MFLADTGSPGGVQPGAQPGVSAAANPQAGLFGDLLDRFTEIVGPAASEATFHYASLQEGVRLGTGHGPKDLAAALARVDGVVGQKSRILADGDVVRIAVAGSALLASGNPVRQAVVRGLLEGMLRAVRGRTYAGRIVESKAGSLDAVLEFQEEVSHGHP